MNGEILLPVGLCILCLLCHHFQLRYHSLLFNNFKQFNIETDVAHHPIIKKEVDDLLAKGATEPSTGGADFYSNIFVVYKTTGDL